LFSDLKEFAQSWNISIVKKKEGWVSHEKEERLNKRVNLKRDLSPHSLADKD